MATNRLTEEGIFSSLRERYGSIDNALAARAEGWAGVGAEASIADESSLREALAGPQHDQIIAILIGLAKAPPVDGEALPIHAEKNQDIEVENDETHVAAALGARRGVWDDTDIVHVLEDGPSTLLGVHDDGEIYARLGPGAIIADIPGHGGEITGNADGDGQGEVTLRFQRVAGDWNGDGRDTVGITGDFDGDGDTDGADLLA